MNAFNIWKSEPNHQGPTGPWKFILTMESDSEETAVESAKLLFGEGTYRAYEAFVDCKLGFGGGL